MQDPRTPHLKATFHLLRYLKQEPTPGVHLFNHSDSTIQAFCDSDWASCPYSRRSVRGYLVLLGNIPIRYRASMPSNFNFAVPVHKAITQGLH